MIQFILYDRWGEWIAPIDGVSDYTITHTADGCDTLELVLSGNKVQPSKEDRILFRDGYGWNEVLVTGDETTEDEKGRATQLFCENSITELRRKDIPILEGGERNSTMLNAIVEGTWWYVGTQGEAEEYSVEEVSAMEALNELADAQEGIIHTDIQVDDYKVIRRTVSIIQPETEFCGIRFDYRRNIKSISRVIEEDDIYTRVIAKGGSYTQEEHVWDEDIQDWLWKQVTKNYEVTVQDDALLPYWGWPTKDGTIRHSETRWSDSTISNEKFAAAKGKTVFVPEVEEALRKAAMKQLATYGPRISYSADVELFDQDINVAQLAQITDYDFDPPLMLEGTVMKTIETPEGKTVVFGTIASTIADTIMRQSRKITMLTGESSVFYA